MKQEKKQKIRLGMILAVLAVVLFAVVTAYNRGVLKLVDQYYSKLLEGSASKGKELIRENMEGDFEYLSSLANGIALWDDIQSPEIMKWLKDQQKDNEWYVVITPDGHGMASNGQTKDYSQNEFFKKACKEDRIISDLQSPVLDGENQVVALSVQIRKDGGLKGTLAGVYGISQIGGLMNLPAVLGESVYYVVRDNGEALVWPLGGENPLGLSQESSLIDAAKEHSELNEIIDAMKSGTSGSVKSRGDSKSWNRISYMPLDVNGWYFIDVLPDDFLLKSSSTLRKIMWSIGALTAAVLLVMAFFVIRFYQQREKMMERYAMYDKLTGLPNGRRLQDLYKNLPEKGKDYSYVLFHVDDFTQINTIFGFRIGGNLLRGIAKELTDRLGEKEYAVRISEDLFALLLRAEDENSFANRLNEIFESLEKIRLADGTLIYEYRCFFAGVVCKLSEQEKEKDITEINNEVKACLDRMPKANTTKWQYFDQDARQEIALYNELENDIVRAIASQEFVSYFQPQYNIVTGEIIGAELLARWDNKTKGLILPGQFIPIMEKIGCILELDLVMLEIACKKLRNWLDEGLMPVPMTINVSRLNIYREDFVSKAVGITDRYRVPRNMIILETPEREVSLDNGKIMSTSKELKENGFMLSIEDFGRGQISLDAFQELPLDVIKLNKDFVLNAVMDDRKHIVVDHVLEMARELNISVVASGVETKMQADYLQKHGCTVAQGFYFARPMSDEEFAKLIFKER